MKLKSLSLLLLCLLPFAGSGQVKLGLLPEASSVTGTDRVLIVAPGANSPGRLISYPALFANSNLYFGSFAGDGASVTNLPASSITGAPWLSSTSNSWTGSFTGLGNGLTNLPYTSITNAPWLSSTSNNWIGSFSGSGAGITNLVLNNYGITNPVISGATQTGIWTNIGMVTTGGARETNYATGNWLSQSNGTLTLGGSNTPATITLTGASGGITLGGTLSVQTNGTNYFSASNGVVNATIGGSASDTALSTTAGKAFGLYKSSFNRMAYAHGGVPQVALGDALWLRGNIPISWVGTSADPGATLGIQTGIRMLSAGTLEVVATNNTPGSLVVSNSVTSGTITNTGTVWSANVNTTATGGTNRAVDWSSQTNAYDDIVFPMTSLTPPGAEAPATFSYTSGQSGDQMALVFSVNNIFHVEVQTPHTWVAGTQVYPHLHIEPQTAGAITSVWRVAYSIADIGSVFPADTVETNQMIIAAGQQWFSKLVNMPTNGIVMTGKVGPSTMVRMKYTLLSTTASLHVLSFDIHIRTGGSPQPYNP